MKRTFLLLTLGALIASPVLLKADDSTPPPPPQGGEHHRGPDLTDAEKAELKKAHDAAIAANPDLATEEKSIHEKMDADRSSGNPPSDADKEAFKAFHEKMDAAMIKADPAVEPILKKMKAGHHRGGGPDGPPPPPPSNT